MSHRCTLLAFCCLVPRSPLSPRRPGWKPKTDLRLELSDAGRIAGMQIGPTALPLIGAGGFAIADFQDQPPPVNLVPNPGFEDGARGWRLSKGQTLDRQVFHAGAVSARLEVPGPSPGSSTLEVFVPVKPNTRYRVGCGCAASTWASAALTPRSARAWQTLRQARPGGRIHTQARWRLDAGELGDHDRAQDRPALAPRPTSIAPPARSGWTIISWKK